MAPASIQNRIIVLSLATIALITLVFTLPQTNLNPNKRAKTTFWEGEFKDPTPSPAPTAKPGTLKNDLEEEEIANAAKALGITPAQLTQKLKPLGPTLPYTNPPWCYQPALLASNIWGSFILPNKDLFLSPQSENLIRDLAANTCYSEAEKCTNMDSNLIAQQCLGQLQTYTNETFNVPNFQERMFFPAVPLSTPIPMPTKGP